MSAAHVINRLPTPILNNNTPFECLYNKPSNYNHLRVTGCLAFASNPSHTTDKFQARGVPCVFLGYPPPPPLKKGYKLLNLLFMVQFVCRDVIFHEHIFPFTHGSTSSYMQPLPTPNPNQSLDHT